MLPQVLGDAEFRVASPGHKVTVSFDNLTVYVNGVSKAFRVLRLKYVVAFAGNALADKQGRVHGGLYGPHP